MTATSRADRVQCIIWKTLENQCQKTGAADQHMCHVHLRQIRDYANKNAHSEGNKALPFLALSLDPGSKDPERARTVENVVRLLKERTHPYRSPRKDDGGKDEDEDDEDDTDDTDRTKKGESKREQKKKNKQEKKKEEEEEAEKKRVHEIAAAEAKEAKEATLKRESEIRQCNLERMGEKKATQDIIQQLTRQIDQNVSKYNTCTTRLQTLRSRARDTSHATERDTKIADIEVNARIENYVLQLAESKKENARLLRSRRDIEERNRVLETELEKLKSENLERRAVTVEDDRAKVNADNDDDDDDDYDYNDDDDDQKGDEIKFEDLEIEDD